MKTLPRAPICAGLLLAGFVLPGCPDANEFVPPPPPEVTVERPLVQEVTTYTEFTGRTEAVDTVEVRARVKGFLKSVDFEPGQMITAGNPEDPEDLGDLLFTIEPEPFEAAVNAARAALAQTVAARDLAKVTLDKAQSAYDKGAVSEIEMAEKRAELDAENAAIDAAQAELDNRLIDLSYTKIHAPITGRISRELVDTGNLVGAGESTLLTVVVQDHPIYAYIDVSERDLLTYIQSGRGGGRPSAQANENRKQVKLQLADGSTFEHSGVIDFAENRVDPKTGTLKVRATFPNPDGALYPGLFVRVLAPDTTGEQMLVPEVALLRDLAGEYVLVADEQNIVQRRTLAIGQLVGARRIVESGLGPDERVIVNGIQRAIAGNPVNPQEQQPEAATGGAGDPSSSEPAVQPGTDDASQE